MKRRTTKKRNLDVAMERTLKSLARVKGQVGDAKYRLIMAVLKPSPEVLQVFSDIREALSPEVYDGLLSANGFAHTGPIADACRPRTAFDGAR